MRIRELILLCFTSIVTVSAFAGSTPTAKLTASKSGASDALETLASGVQIQHVTRGSGPTPSITNTVTVHYRGTLVSTGAEFDSSYTRGTPATFALQQVVKCWGDAIPRMAVGGKAIITCPAVTAYGPRAIGALIPANSDLRFEVELLGIR